MIRFLKQLVLSCAAGFIVLGVLGATAFAGNLPGQPAKKTYTRPELEAIVVSSALKYGLDPLLVACLITQESGWRVTARSSADARGIMQFMETTARDWGLEVSSRLDERLIPERAIPAGCAYLRSLLDQFGGNVELALAGYNSGGQRVVNSGYQVPHIPETMNYVSSIARMYRQARGGRIALMPMHTNNDIRLSLSGKSSLPTPPENLPPPRSQMQALEAGMSKSSFVWVSDENDAGD